MASSEPSRPTAGKDLSDRVRSLRLSDRPTAGRSNRLGALGWVVAVVLLMMTGAFGYRAYRLGSLSEADLDLLRDSAAAQKDAAPTTTAFTGSVAGVGEVVLQQKGYITPISLIQVSPKVGGQLVWLSNAKEDPSQPPFEEGAFFQKGALLARIESDDYQFEYDQAYSAYQTAKRRYDEIRKIHPEELKQARAEEEEANKNGIQLKLEMERNRKLTMSSAVAQREMEQARYTYEANSSRIAKLQAGRRMIEARQNLREQAAEHEVKQAEAMKNKAKWRLDNTKIVAPVTGTILTKKAELGNIVNPSAFSSGISASLCEMADLTKLEVDLSVQERDIAGVRKDQPCLIMPEAYASDPEFLAKHPRGYTGRVSRLMPTADRAKGAIPVRVVIDVPDKEAGVYLRPDMGALVSFLKVDKKETSAPPVNKQPAPAQSKPTDKKPAPAGGKQK